MTKRIGYTFMIICMIGEMGIKSMSVERNVFINRRERWIIMTDKLITVWMYWALIKVRWAAQGGVVFTGTPNN